jgi:uncharacterized membrane protein YphA (DoxX/SURF4 family)
MKKVPMIARYLLGLIFFVFGLNGFLNFLPAPPLAEAGLKFIMALVETGYLMPLVKGIEVFAGALLLAGYFVPLALLLLAPIVVNILLFHTILSPGAPLPLIILALGVIVAYDRKEAFKSVLRMKQV